MSKDKFAEYLKHDPFFFNNFLIWLVENNQTVPNALLHGIAETEQETSKDALEKVITRLLEQKGDLNQRNDKGEIAINIATTKNKYEFVKLLIEHKADINLEDSSEITPLIGAAKENHIELVKLLLENKADINHTTLKKGTALSYASKTIEYNTIELLLENKADINHKDNESKTPFHYICETEDLYTDLIKLFIKNKADINLQDLSWRDYYSKTEKPVRLAIYLHKYLKEANLIEPLFNNTKPTNLLEKALSHLQTDVIDEQSKQKLLEKCTQGLEKVLDNKAIASILKIAADSDYEIVLFDLAHSKIAGFCSSINKKIFVLNAQNITKDCLIDTIVHEFTHFAMLQTYNNNSKPYYLKDNYTKDEIFMELAEKAANSLPEEFRYKDSKDSIRYKDSISSKEQDYPCELIAYYFGTLVTDIIKETKILDENFGPHHELTEMLTESMKELNPEITTSDLTTSYDKFWEETLGTHVVENINELGSDNEGSDFGMGA